MLVHAVAGVDDDRAAEPRQQVRRAGRGVPHDDHVGRHRLEVADGVEERFPFVTLDCATAMLSVSALRRFSATSNDMRVRVLGSKNRLTTVRPRRVGTFLIGRGRDLGHRLRGVENQADLVRLEVGDAQQVP